MALADPQSIAIDGTPISLARILTSTGVGTFTSADGLTTLTITPTTSSKSKRVALRLNQKKVTSDPLVATTNVVKGITVTVNLTRDLDGYSDADATKVVSGFLNWASVPANLAKWIPGEN